MIRQELKRFAVIALLFVPVSGWANAIELINKGFQAASHGAWAVALENYSKAINSGELLGASLAYVYRIRGDLYYRTGSYDNAIRDFNKVLQINPGDEAALNNRGSTWFAKKNYQKAIQDYSESLKINPENGQTYHNRSLIRLEQGNYELSIRDSSEAIRINPGNYYAYINRGSARFGLGEIDKAIEDYTKAISINPENSGAYYNRSVVLLEKQELTRAISDSDEAIRLDPNDPGLYVYREQLWKALGEKQRAVQDYKKAEKITGQTIPAKKSENQKTAVNTTGVIEENQQEIDNYTRILETDNNNSVLLEKRGWAYFYEANYEAALSDFRAIAKINPQDIYSQLWLFITSGHAGSNPFDAVSADVKPADLEQWPGILLQFYLGKRSEAQVLASFPSDTLQSRLEKSCEANYYIGEYYLINGQNDKALEHFRNAIATGLSGFIAFRNSNFHIKNLIN